MSVWRCLAGQRLNTHSVGAEMWEKEKHQLLFHLLACLISLLDEIGLVS